MYASEGRCLEVFVHKSIDLDRPLPVGSPAGDLGHLLLGKRMSVSHEDPDAQHHEDTILVSLPSRLAPGIWVRIGQSIIHDLESSLDPLHVTAVHCLRPACL
jgi:hypothetical protein